MNNVNVVGRLVKDPEFKTVSGGEGKDDIGLSRFTIAVDVGWGERKETAFLDFTAWRKLAELVNQYCSKGDKVAVGGRVKQDNWEDGDGNKRSKIVFEATDVDFMQSQGDNSESGSSPKTPSSSGDDDEDDDLPF